MVMGFPDDNQDKLPEDESPAEKMQVDVPATTPGLGGIDSNLNPKEPAVGGIVAKIGIPYKSILGFFTVFLGQVLARATVNDIPVLPENASGWLSLIGGSFVAAAVIYFKANVYTTPQVEQKAVAAEKKHI